MRIRKICQLLIFVLFYILSPSIAKEYHVSIHGNDNNTGTYDSPFQTIGRATYCAYPGDIITVHEGVYREMVSPIRGGKSQSKRIIYRAAPGEKVEIKGSERITTWESEGNGVWKVSIPESFFENYNPYTEKLGGDWYFSKNKILHTGEVYLNGKSLYEVSSLEKVYSPYPLSDTLNSEESLYCWFTKTENGYTTIWANFHDMNPNKSITEINVRPSCFYPARSGINYITLQGFHFSQAATQWAPPTAEQIGIVGTHWSKGWIIEDNVIHDSKCSGITLGKDKSTGHNVWTHNPQKDGSVHYIEVIFRALNRNWDKRHIGGHIVRRNTIYNCEQTGICGSLGAVFSQIYENHIYNIWTKRQFDGPEIAGIKIHGAIDVLIKDNRIHNATMGLFLDWMCQGTRISGNLCYNNELQDIYMEVAHGPFIVDNNLLLSHQGIMSMSQGGAYLHNFIAGTVKSIRDNRFVPYHFAHSTSIHGFSVLYCGDDRWYNNIFAGITSESTSYFKQRKHFNGGNYGLSIYNKNAQHPIYASNNIYWGIANPSKYDKKSFRDSTIVSHLNIIEMKNGEVYLKITGGDIIKSQEKIIKTEILGKTRLSNLPFDNPDGSSLIFDNDYFGKKRIEDFPSIGPWEYKGKLCDEIKIWPKSI